MTQLYDTVTAVSLYSTSPLLVCAAGSSLLWQLIIIVTCIRSLVSLFTWTSFTVDPQHSCICRWATMLPGLGWLKKRVFYAVTGRWDSPLDCLSWFRTFVVDFCCNEGQLLDYTILRLRDCAWILYENCMFCNSTSSLWIIMRDLWMCFQSVKLAVTECWQK